MKLSRFYRQPTFLAVLLLAGLATTWVPVIFGGVSVTSHETETQAAAPAAFSWKYKYDVVSVKPLGHNFSPEPQYGFLFDMAPNGISIRRATLVNLARSAYSEGQGPMGFRDNQIFGAPDWANKDWFAIDAKMDESVAGELKKLNPTQQNLARTQMLQAILVDYFKLTFHVENREGPVYFLTVAKNGPKFKEAKPGEIYPKGPFQQMPWQAGWVVMDRPDPGSEKRIGLGADMTTLTQNLSMRLHSTVVDKTGLTGKYDFQLQWAGIDATPAESESPWPPLLTAIQQQLGLKLETGKGPTKVLVIDHVEKPSGN